jgi:probable HAF family extracellular repeat protein
MQTRMSRRLVAASTMSVALSCLMQLANAQSLVWLGTLPEPWNKWSTAWGVSRGGSYVVGFSGGNSCPTGLVCSHGFYWIAPNGPMLDLNPPGFDASNAWDISADGLTVVGAIFHYYGDYSTSHAVRWRRFQVEALWPGSTVCCSEAYGVSPDGVFAVGWYNPDRQSYSRPARWRDTQLDGLLPFEGEARDTSADGLVTVGWLKSSDIRRAFKWYRQDERVELLDPLPGYQHSEAYAVSADGSVVVGWSYNTCDDGRATRWIVGQVQDLGVLPTIPQ